jgi:hypothetical protein
MKSDKVDLVSKEHGTGRLLLWIQMFQVFNFAQSKQTFKTGHPIHLACLK